jgi:hypothetical protein
MIPELLVIGMQYAADYTCILQLEEFIDGPQ